MSGRRNYLVQYEGPLSTAHPYAAETPEGAVRGTASKGCHLGRCLAAPVRCRVVEVDPEGTPLSATRLRITTRIEVDDESGGCHDRATQQPGRPHYLAWNGTEWVDTRCGCRYHPDDDQGTHGGAPHVHLCEKHRSQKRGDS